MLRGHQLPTNGGSIAARWLAASTRPPSAGTRSPPYPHEPGAIVRSAGATKCRMNVQQPWCLSPQSFGTPRRVSSTVLLARGRLAPPGLDAGGAGCRRDDRRPPVFPPHEVPRRVLAEDLLDHACPGRLRQLRAVEHDLVADLRSHCMRDDTRSPPTPPQVPWPGRWGVWGSTSRSPPASSLRAWRLRCPPR